MADGWLIEVTMTVGVTLAVLGILFSHVPTFVVGAGLVAAVLIGRAESEWEATK